MSCPASLRLKPLAIPPGHLGDRIDSEGRQLVLTGDMANHYVMGFQRPDWGFGFDVDKGLAAAIRRRVLAMLAAERLPFVGYHMPFPSIGYVEPMGDAFRNVAESDQFDL